MGQAFTAFFAFIIKMFSALEKTASAIDHIAGWADKSAEVFKDEATHNRNMRLKAMYSEEALADIDAQAAAAPAAKPKAPAVK